MESCEICGQSRAAKGTAVVRCSGPCGGIVHASCADASGIMLTATNEQVKCYWFCDRCQRGLRPVPTKRGALPELPPEMWTEIFKHLPNYSLLKIRLVCRCWRDLVGGSPALLAKLTVSFMPREGIDGNYKPDNLLPVSNANIISSVTEMGPWWSAFGKGLTELITDSGAEIKPSVLMDILRQTPNLRCLNLYHLILTDEHFPKEDFRLDKLEKLSIEGLEYEEILAVFREVFCNCNLKTLLVSWTDYTEPYRSRTVEPDEMAKFVSAFQNTLEELDINCWDEFLIELMKLDRLKLRKLSLTYEQLEDGRLLVELCRKLPLLEYLNVQEAFEFDEENANLLNEICQLLPNLKFLSVNATHVNLAFLSNLVKLQTLEMICDYATFTIIHFTFPANSFSNLKRLHLEHLQFPARRLKRLLATMPTVRTLSFRRCKFDTWTDLLDALGSLPQLEHLTLMLIHANETTRRRSFPKLARLKYFSLFACKLSPRLFATILRICPCLREIDLDSMKEAHVEEVLNASSTKLLPELSAFTIRACCLSKEAKSYIRFNCRSLEKVDFLV